MVYTSPQLSYPRDATVTDILLDYNFNNTVLEKPAIIDGPSGATVYTYGSLRSSVKKLASHLSQYILNDYPEATVAVLVPNSVSDQGVLDHSFRYSISNGSDVFGS